MKDSIHARVLVRVGEPAEEEAKRRCEIQAFLVFNGKASLGPNWLLCIIIEDQMAGTLC